MTGSSKHSGPAGFVDVNFAEGALFLKDRYDRIYRLHWGKTQEGESADVRRAIPPGTYTLIAYRIVDRSEEDLWHIAVTSRSISRIEVKMNETTRVEIERSIGIGGELAGGRVNLLVQGQANAGLTIYKNGARIPIDWKLVDGDGRPLQSGAIRYG